MNLLILGATSRAGKKLIANALRRGHIVTALADNPNKLVYYCNKCGTEDKTIIDDNVIICKTQIKKSEQSFNHIINKFKDESLFINKEIINKYDWAEYNENNENKGIINFSIKYIKNNNIN